MRKVHRRWALEIGRPGQRAVRIEQQRVVFDAMLRGGDRSTTGAVEVWMPAPGLRGIVDAPDAVTRLMAGYEDGGPVEIMRGETVADSVIERRDGPDRVLSWQVTGARRATLDAVPSRSWSRVRASDVIEYVRQDAGIPADVIRVGADYEFARGYLTEGSVRDELTIMCEATGSTWTIVDGRLRVLPVGEQARPRRELWSASTGLLPSPAQTTEGVIASALLSPSLRPGDGVRIVSEGYAGDVVVREVRHAGDSHGQAWYTTIQGRPA